MSSVDFLHRILIKNIELVLGFAIGIFVVFVIIRFRTSPISTREKTYLFVVISIGATNGLIPNEVNYLSILTSRFYILAIIYFIERHFFKSSKIIRKEIIYINLALIHPNQNEALNNELKETYDITFIKSV